MMSNSFYSEDELKSIGFKSLGSNVLISKKASIYSHRDIEIGSNVRIDDFCLLSGSITIGSNVHLSAFSALYGGGGIVIGDFCGISARSIIYSVSDDFSGEYMISPMVDKKFRNLHSEKVTMESYSQLGANTIVMPGVRICEGSVTGAFSFVKNNLEPWSINAGVPAKKIKARSKNLLGYTKNSG